MTGTGTLSAEEIDRLADEGEVDMTRFFKAGTDRMPNLDAEPKDAMRKVTHNIPEWVVSEAELEARHLAVSRSAVFNVWLAEKAKESRRERAAM